MVFVILMVIGFGGEFASERQQRRGRGAGSVICVFIVCLCVFQKE